MQDDAYETLNDNINLVVETGGTQNWYMPQLGQTDNCRFTITPNGIDNYESISNRNMGDKDSLADFINYGLLSYPAEHYCLLFWDHGNGPIIGFGNDQLYKNDSLTLSEMSQSLQLSEMDDQQFELIGFDACMMGNFETAYVLSDYANYMVGSCDLEPLQGWDYHFLSTFQDSTVEGDIVGQMIADSYMKSYSNENCPLTMSVLDLDSIKKLADVLQEQLDLLQATWNSNMSYQSLSKDRTISENYGIASFNSSLSDIVDFRLIMDWLLYYMRFLIRGYEVLDSTHVHYLVLRGYLVPLRD
ncbi:MAG TPA: clostripain-related cysteine peptidase, partial [Lachnospiraceae bacterium]|nr:clostripain-related cysteine peptidase [Lachnospiraceae bacterium]